MTTTRRPAKEPATVRRFQILQFCSLSERILRLCQMSNAS